MSGVLSTAKPAAPVPSLTDVLAGKKRSLCSDTSVIGAVDPTVIGCALGDAAEGAEDAEDNGGDKKNIAKKPKGKRRAAKDLSAKEEPECKKCKRHCFFVFVDCL